LAKNDNIFPRASLRRTIVCPFSSTPWIWNQLLDVSSPIVMIAIGCLLVSLRCNVLGKSGDRPSHYARDDRPWGGADPPAVAYLYAPDRKAARPIEHLAGFTGTLQVDGYGGYAALARRGDVQLAFCWAHVRRPFYELAETSPVAADALARIATLYAIDAEARGQSPEQRRAARREKSRPVVDELRRFLDAKLAQLSRKSTLAEAIRYALTRWEGLTRFLDDGRIELDSNVVERTIRPLALNRKNSLFAGSDDGGDHWAVIASMIETCKLNGINPQAWLADTLTCLAAGHSNLRRDELMPWNYIPAVG
jgi:transposase